jgi:hypothetical protein
VPPGTYSLKHSIDELLSKKVSNRGPYDLFSEDRSAPMKTGHYMQDLDHKLGPGQYTYKNSFLDDMQDYTNNKKGVFGKIAQYPAISGDRLSVALSSSLQPRNPDW